jgi:hypothetical protein
LPPEPVSPELVLVDPELARRERARLEEKAHLESLFDVASLRRALESQPPPVEEAMRRRPEWRDAAAFSKRRLVPAALMVSVLANGLFAAHLVARKGEEATQVAVRMVTLTETAASLADTAASIPPTSGAPMSIPPTSGAPTGTREPLAAPKVTARPATKSAVELKVGLLILSAPARKLPRDFIDRATGLVKNNVQVVCRKAKQRSFLCAVRLSATASKALYVRYRTGKKGQGVFKWYGYRRS